MVDTWPDAQNKYSLAANGASINNGNAATGYLQKRFDDNNGGWCKVAMAVKWSESNGIKGLGFLGGGKENCDANPTLGYSLNRAGDIVGRGRDLVTYNSYPIVCWSESPACRFLSDFGGPQGQGEAAEINDRGEITGTVLVDGFYRAFKYSHSSYDFVPLGENTSNFGVGINEKGTIAGFALDSDPGKHSAFLYLSDRNLVFLPDPFGGNSATAIDVSDNSDKVVGWAKDLENRTRAILWQRSTTWPFTDLGDLGGGSAAAESINSSGVIVGTSTIGLSGETGFKTGGYSNVTPRESFKNTGAGINTGTGTWHGFIFVDGNMHDINDLLLNRGYFTVAAIWSINDNGWITGVGQYDNDPVGIGFVARPV